MFCQGDTTREQGQPLEVPQEVRSVCSVLVCSFVDIGVNLLIQEKAERHRNPELQFQCKCVSGQNGAKEN